MGEDCVEAGILKQAMEMELEGKEFYLGAAAKVENRLGKSMLESLAADEQGHYERLLQLQEGASEAAAAQCEADFADAGARVKAAFADFGAKAAEELAGGTNDLEALDTAMKMERKGYDLYKDAAAGATDANAQKVLLFLAGEEEKHFEVLQNMHRYLSDPANWFLEEEQGLLDGG